MVTKANSKQLRRGFCIFQDTLCQGPIPIEHDGCGRLIVYRSRGAAERSIADDVKERIDLFLQGDLSFEEAVTVDEYVQEVVVGVANRSKVKFLPPVS